MPRVDTSQREVWHLAELLDCRPDQGIMRLHEQRVVLLNSAALGLLQQDMIDNFGVEAARRLFLRFGYVHGYHDALSLRDRFKWTGEQGLRAGATLLRLEGIARTDVVRLEQDAAAGYFRQDLVWHDSYAAEQHVQHCGMSSSPVCWSLVGYASGYATACLGIEIYFRESECLGQGASKCAVIGRDAASWGDDAVTMRADFQGNNLRDEVERLRGAAHGRLQEVERRAATKVKREQTRLRDRVTRAAASKQFVANTAVMKEVLETAARVAPLDTTVLIRGESGTGKEFIVRLIHDESRRAGGAFVSINCAALTDTLLESELFGHVRGAFTGAVREKAGLFEVATNGTLFLDEIGEAAPGVQAKLLRALQEREIRRVGGERTIKVNARVIAATNRDLQVAVAAGTFREDLYFRLSGFVITVPPLRERRNDIPLLVHDFVRRAAGRVKKDVHAVAADALTVLMQYRWPGNVRELEHAIERAVIVARGQTILTRDLPPDLVQTASQETIDDILDLRQLERVTILRALERFRGNRRAAASALHISTATLWRKVKHLGLVAGQPRSPNNVEER